MRFRDFTQILGPKTKIFQKITRGQKKENMQKNINILRGEILKGKKHRPHEVDPEIGFELNKEVKELTQISRIAMGVEHSEASARVPQIERHDFVPSLGVQQQHVERRGRRPVAVAADRQGRRPCCGDGGELSAVALLYGVGGRRGREEGEFGGQLRYETPHFTTTTTEAPPERSSKAQLMNACVCSL